MFWQLAWVMSAVLMISAAMAGAEDPEGRQLFVEKRCNTCHSVESADIEARLEKKDAPDLSSAAELIESPEWAEEYVLRKVEKDGEKHPRPYKGTEDELEAIIAWLMSLESS